MNIMLPKNSTSCAARARFSVVHSVSVAALIFAASAGALAQDNRDKGRREGGGDRGGDRGNFNPADMQARMMTALRERFGVTNDDEWAVISERITKVSELRRNMGGGMGSMMFGRGGPGGGDSRGGTSSRTSTSSRSGGNNDVAALTAAVQDKLPEAEIKARLDRVRELRKENELKLTKAQEELRAVLSVRQEAIAVLAGLLP
jgi:hypothetical protein